MVQIEFSSLRVAHFASLILNGRMPYGMTNDLWIKIKSVAASVLTQAPSKLLINKVTSELVATYASELERMEKPSLVDPEIWKEIKSIAGSALTQSPNVITKDYFEKNNLDMIPHMAAAKYKAMVKFDINKDYYKETEQSLYDAILFGRRK
jgi:hypothetical protein